MYPLPHMPCTLKCMHASSLVADGSEGRARVRGKPGRAHRRARARAHAHTDLRQRCGHVLARHLPALQFLHQVLPPRPGVIQDSFGREAGSQRHGRSEARRRRPESSVRFKGGPFAVPAAACFRAVSLPKLSDLRGCLE